MSETKHAEMVSAVKKQRETTTAETEQERTTTSVTGQGEVSMLDSSLRDSMIGIVGSSISLRCSSSNDTVFRWSYCPYGSGHWMIIYNGKISKQFHGSGRVTVKNCIDRHCTFTVRDLELRDAGRYSCMNVGKYWTLTVLGKAKCI